MTMIRRALGLSSSSTDYSSVSQALMLGSSDALVENEILDFKSQLPNKPDAKLGLARSISAFANGGGGIILCGVLDDDDDRASEITPVKLGAAVTNLQRALDRLIAPSVNARYIEVPDDSPGTHGFLVIDVLPSGLTPHTVQINDKPEFPIRRNKVNGAMSEAEIERAYRNRFASQSDMASRLSSS